MRTRLSFAWSLFVFTVTSLCLAAGEPPKKDPPPVVHTDIGTLGPQLGEDGTEPPPGDMIQRLERMRQDMLADNRLPAAESAVLQAAIRQLRAQQNANKRTPEEQEHAKALRDLLTAKLRKNPDNRMLLESLAMYRLFLNEPDEALPLLQRAKPASDRDLAHRLLTGYVYLRLGEYRKGAAVVEEVQQMLQPHLPLRMTPPVFCTRVRKFRVYDKRPDTPMRPGEDLLIYLEVSGVQFRDAKDGKTFSLRFVYEFRNEQQEAIQEPVDVGVFSETYDTPVNDMDIVLQARVPNSLAPGRYVFALRCTDVLSEKTASAQTSFRVATTTTNHATASSNP